MLNVAVHEEAGDRRFVDPHRHVRVGEQRLDLRPEYEMPPVAIVEQRLLARAIAREHEPAGAVVPQRDGKHAVDRLDEGRAALLVQVDENFGVGLGPETMALPFELGAELAEVVDLAVEDHADRPVLVRHRLIRRGGQVDDPQAAEPEAGAPARRHEQPFVVRSAMDQPVAHRDQHVGTDRPA